MRILNDNGHNRIKIEFFSRSERELFFKWKADSESDGLILKEV